LNELTKLDVYSRVDLVSPVEHPTFNYASSGSLTLIVEYLISSGNFTSAVIAEQQLVDNRLKVLMRRTNDSGAIRKASGSQYLFAENWGEIFKYVRAHPDDRLVITAPPCMIEKLKSLSDNLFLISFCCDNTYDDRHFTNNLANNYGLEGAVESCEFRNGQPWPRFNLKINTRDTELIVPDYYDDLYAGGVMARAGCESCTIYVAEADIMAADPWNLLTYAESTVMFQSPAGQKVLGEMCSKGYLSRWQIATAEFAYAHRYSFAAKAIKQHKQTLLKRLISSSWIKPRIFSNKLVPELLVDWSKRQDRKRTRKQAKKRPDLRVAMIAYTKNNKGTEALTKAIIQLFREFAQLNNKSIAFSIIGEQDPGVRPYFKGSLFTTERPLHPWFPLNRSVKQVLRTIKHYWLSDLVVHSGGDMLTGDAVVRLTNLLVPLLMRKKVIILSETLGPYRTPGRRGWITRTLAKKLFENVAYLSSRDDDSIEFLREIGIERPLSKTPDLAFQITQSVESSEIQYLKKQTVPLIAFNFNILLFDTFPDGREALLSELSTFFDRTYAALDGNCRFVLFSHVFHQNQQGLGSDRQVVELIRQVYPADEFSEKFLVHDHNLAFEQLRASVAYFDVVVSSRMHLCVSALSQQIPVIPIANNHKYKSVIGDINGTEYLIDMEQFSGVDLSKLTLKLIASRDEQVALIARNLESLQTEIETFKQSLFLDLGRVCF